jgi:two-component system OmpR family response regulator
VKELPVSKVAPHLLIVDDDKELCSLLSKFLSRHGYRVSVAHNGSEMASILEASRVNLVILDLMLPGEDGLVLCRRLRTTSTLPIIMLTAISDETDRIIGLERARTTISPKCPIPANCWRGSAPCFVAPARLKRVLPPIKSGFLNLPAGGWT